MPAAITANVTAATASQVRPRLSVSVVNARGTATASVAASHVEYIDLTIGARLDTTGKFKFVAEIVVMLDALRISTFKPLSDSFGLTDRPRLTPGKTLADSASPTDAITAKGFVKGLADAAGVPDHTAFAVSKLLADAFTSSDRPYITAGKTLASAFGLTDAQIVNLQKVIHDSVSLVETFYAVLVFIRDVDDTITPTDRPYITVTKAPFSESVSVSDAYNHLPIKVLSDAVAMDDGASVGDGSTFFMQKNVNNVVWSVDMAALQTGKALSDSVGTSESGLVLAQNYCDITYFLEDYVGASSIF